MTFQAFDSPDPGQCAAKAKQLAAAGKQAALLYISPINPSGPKTVRRAHIDAIHAAGIAVGFICEGWGGSDNFAHHDINGPAGTRDGGFCGHYMQTLGAPDNVMVAPTVDNDANSVQIQQLVLPYFRAFRSALPQSYAMGAYACGAVLFSLEGENNIVRVPWLSNALGWSRSREYLATGRAVIVQRPETRLLGIDVDLDTIGGNDLAAAGFWLPPSAAAAPSDATIYTVIATCFGGDGDPEASAYGGSVDPEKPGVALPFHFEEPRPKVKVARNGLSVVCDIVDVGPHNTNDPYWKTGGRPQAESEHGNGAGIDLTPAVFAALGLSPHDPAYGLTQVQWEFA